MELAGVAADIVDASSRTRRGHPPTSTPIPTPTRTLPSTSPPPYTPTETATAAVPTGWSAHANNGTGGALPPTPLELFGYVGEGAPAESMAQEALLLWVGVFRLPPQSRALLQRGHHTAQRDKAQGDEALGGKGLRGAGLGTGGRGDKRESLGDKGVGGGDKGLGEEGVVRGGEEEGRKDIEAVEARRSRLEALDKPVLKAILCASGAIRQRVAQSLLQACGVGPAAAAAEAVEAAAAAVIAAAAAGDKEEVAVEDCAEEKLASEEDNASARSSTSSVTAASSEFVESDALEKEAECAPTPQLSQECDPVAAAMAASVVSSSPGTCAAGGLEQPAAANGGEEVPATGALSLEKGVPGAAVCAAGGGVVTSVGGGVVREVSVRDELREHVVRLLLDHIPRTTKPGQEVEVGRGLGAGAGARGGGVCGVLERRRDCTQLFQVLCALVEELIEVRRHRSAGGRVANVNLFLVQTCL